MQSEFYTKGGFLEAGLQDFSQNKALDENRAYVVFKGGGFLIASTRRGSIGHGDEVYTNQEVLHRYNTSGYLS